MTRTMQQKLRKLLDEMVENHKKYADCEWLGYYLCRCELAKAIREMTKAEIYLLQYEIKPRKN